MEIPENVIALHYRRIFDVLHFELLKICLGRRSYSAHLYYTSTHTTVDSRWFENLYESN